MAFENAQKSRILLGSLNASGFTRSFSFPITNDMLDVTTLADTSKVFIPGQVTSTGSLDMVLDTDTTSGGQWDVIKNFKGSSPLPLTYGHFGIAVGATVIMAHALESQFSVSSTASGTVDASVATQNTDATEFGTVLESLGAVTSDGNGTARDGGAASSNGGIAHLHVSAYSGLTSDVITIEHSVDGSTSWATLATFTTVTGLTSERVVVAAGTTVRRYLRVVDDVTGTGSVTRTVAFARR